MEIKTNAEWLEWGRRDPLYGVASWANKEVNGSAPWTNTEFYELGRSDWQDFELRWHRYGYKPGTFVEIGCGAGRITKQLARAFERGFGVDVSAEMIRYASTQVTTGNVEWRVSDGCEIPVECDRADGVFSCHVLQHLPSVQAGYAYFAEVHRVLRPGGSLMIHLPVHAYPLAVSQKFSGLCKFMLRRIVEPALSARTAYQRSRMRGGAKPPMHGISFDQWELHRTLVEIGFERAEFVTFPLQSNGALHTFVLATKPHKPDTCGF